LRQLSGSTKLVRAILWS